MCNKKNALVFYTVLYDSMNWFNGALTAWLVTKLALEANKISGRGMKILPVF